MNNAKILSLSLNTPANQVQPTSTRFAPNLEAIQNALKYDRKLHFPSVLEFEKVKNWPFILLYLLLFNSLYQQICSIMDTYEAEGTAISKQYGIKGAPNSKDQAVLLGIASTIMPKLLDKYPDFLALDSTSRRNG